MTPVISPVLLFLLLLFLISILIYLFYTSFIEPGAVYFPTSSHLVKEMVDFAKPGPNDLVMDLGSGDGRILIEFAKKGIPGIGYEIDPVLVLQSKNKIKKLNLTSLIDIRLQSLWKADFNQATIITLYLFPNFMDRLQNILEKKLKHPILLVSHNYEFPRKKYFQKKDNLYLYQFP